MGQVEEIKRRREKKEKSLEKSTKRIGDFQHRPGIPRDLSPSRRSSIVLTSDRLNFGNRRCASTSTNLKFLPRHRCRRRRILCLICSSPMTRGACSAHSFPLPRPYAASTPRKTNEQSLNREQITRPFVFSSRDPFTIYYKGEQVWQTIHYSSLFDRI